MRRNINWELVYYKAHIKTCPIFFCVSFVYRIVKFCYWLTTNQLGCYPIKRNYGNQQLLLRFDCRLRATKHNQFVLTFKYHNLQYIDFLGCGWPEATMDPTPPPPEGKNVIISLYYTITIFLVSIEDTIFRDKYWYRFLDSCQWCY